ncbi:uncharacterized protein LOC110857061 isoform X1 [Folsomia candida]|uniref:uncharacterized protein LOC110857061 isoform X1 n=1 Tax=Folsomia candida TaxID=158441 RepID=UPI00160555AA|nr:uncharacterized protein LOC110857061 isoform X1 [Folsomia candida]
MDTDSSAVSFIVADFISKQEIDIINSNWLVEIDGLQYTYWPNYSKTESRKLEKSVRNGESPDAKTWKIYEVEIVKRYGKYEDARLNLPRLAQEGGISTGAELGRGRRRKTVNRKLFNADSSGDDENDSPLTKSLLHVKTKKSKVTEINRSDSSKFQMPTLVLVQPDETLSTTSRDEPSNTNSSPLPSGSGGIGFSQFHQREECLSESEQNFCQTPRTEVTTPMTFSGRGPTSSLSQERSQDIGQGSFNGTIVPTRTDDIIIRKLDYIQASINELRETFHLALRNQNRTIIEDLDGDEKVIPLNNLPEYDELERKIADPKIRQALIMSLSGSGSTGTDAIYRVLTFLMTDDFAATLSFAGQRGKKSFKDREKIKSCVYCKAHNLNLSSLLYGSAEFDYFEHFKL